MSDKQKKYTWEEVRKHNTLASCWVVVSGVVYDVTEFVPHHPGGKHTLETGAGHDITYLMQTSHTFSDKPWNLLEQYQIGTVDDFVEYTKAQPLYDEIKQGVREYFKSTGLDPKDATFTLQVFVGFMILWCGGLYGFCQGSLLAAAVFGASRALFGIHTMHACSHFAVTHSPFVWKWGNWFCFDVLMGSSHWAWDYQHIVGHHQHTNVFGADPDLPIAKDGDMRLIVDQQKWKSLYKFQHIYLPILYILLGFKVHVYDMWYLLGLKMNGNIPMNRSSTTYALLLATKALFFWYNFYVPLVVVGMDYWTFAKCFFVMECVSGAWLAYFFQVNHISSNVAYSEMGEKSTTEKEWAALQVEGSVDYGHNSMLHILASGTLNYQTVHHLFPSIAPQHYPALAPMIMATCKKHNVKYQCHDNYFIAAYHHVAELYRMGQKGIPAPMAHMD